MSVGTRARTRAGTGVRTGAGTGVRTGGGTRARTGRHPSGSPACIRRRDRSPPDEEAAEHERSCAGASGCRSQAARCPPEAGRIAAGVGRAGSAAAAAGRAPCRRARRAGRGAARDQARRPRSAIPQPAGRLGQAGGGRRRVAAVAGAAGRTLRGGAVFEATGDRSGRTGRRSPVSHLGCGRRWLLGLREHPRGPLRGSCQGRRSRQGVCRASGSARVRSWPCRRWPRIRHG